MNSLVLRQADLFRILQAGYTKYVIYAINLLLVVWIASQLAALTWGMFSPDEPDAPVAVTPGAWQTGANVEKKLISQLPGWHLLGEAREVKAPVTTGVPVDAPDTRLKLTLSGVLASDDPENAHAIIADPRGKDEQYTIGDTLPGNAELSEIYPDRVILKRGGRYETLRLPQDGGSVPAARTTSAPGASGNMSPQARLAEFRRRANRNPKSLNNVLRTAPKLNDGGKIIGYQLSPGRDPRLFEELGFVDKDLVIQVNGLVLSEPENGARALQALKSGNSVSLVLMRDGQQRTLVLDGQ